MGSGIMHDCGPQGEIEETERLASEQDRLEELDRDDNDDSWDTDLTVVNDPSETEPYSEPVDYERLIKDGTYTEVDAQSARLPTLPLEDIKLAISPEDQPPVKHSIHPTKVREYLYYNSEEGDALEVITVPVNKYGDKARASDTTVAFKITFTQDDNLDPNPALAAAIFFPRSIEQIDVLHEIAWALASGRGVKALDAEKMLHTVTKAASHMDVKTTGLMPTFPLSTDFSYDRVMAAKG